MMNLRAGVTYRDKGKVQPYAAALELVGIEPVLISPSHPRSLDGLRGLVLSGGTDLDPALYGQTPAPETEPPDRERDRLETMLLGEALAADMPVLAICRGLQLFNVFHGGTLEQHVPGGTHLVRTPEAPGSPVHEVLVAPESKLAAIFKTPCIPVNSRHHQAVDRVGSGLMISAWSTGDRRIEGLERTDRRFALAVLWHPEDQAAIDQRQRALFQGFRSALSI
jgi:gamma-glutamyl-gamma-aminobutyrate hydrolase PuuD